ncbi:TPA: DNA repair and recombination protein RadA [Candidatus Woesearchaeota archaeon]|nr:DNA repair and recombination protein RadA [Candidatus Woesearchaeota archaeon]HII69455.1 DNA repair and recombination protein RadA [Candidatus Woesearchaeota archaeon]
MASEQTLVEDSLYEEKREQMMDEQPQKEKIGIIDLPGVGAATAEKLEVAGFRDIMSIAVATPAELVDASGISLPVAKKMIAAARATADMGFISGVDILQKRSKIKKLQTGCPSLDNLLGGGFETASIVECFGEFGSGKTQIGHLLAVQTQKLSDDAAVVYIDTENTFRPERIEQLAKGAGLDPEEVLSRIKVARAYNSDHQMLLVEKIDELIQGGLNVKLIVVDSLTAHFRAEFVGRGTLADRQQKLNRHMHMLMKLADLHNLCVYVTNQVMAKPDVFFGDPTQAIGGHIVAHASTFRIYLRKGKKGSRVAKLIDAPNLPDSEANFIVEEGGLRDFK